MDMPFKLDSREKNATVETTEMRDSKGASTSSDSSVEISTAETNDNICQVATDLSKVSSESCDTYKSSTSQNTTNTNEEDECSNCSRLVSCSYTPHHGGFAVTSLCASFRSAKQF